MAKKNMQNIVRQLAPIAQDMPSQNPAQTNPQKSLQKPAKSTFPEIVGDEQMVQFGFRIPKEMRRELCLLAESCGMTMRSFVLSALQEKGLDVEDIHLKDKRKLR